MQPRIEKLSQSQFVGVKTRMSLADNKTATLWQRFMPRRREVENVLGAELYSIEQYDSVGFFRNFNPVAEFTKWAAVEVDSLETTPDGMEKLIIPEGKYAVFTYVGKPSDAQPTFQYIFSEWFPKSEYELDHRPHFAKMGAKYKGEDPTSEEEFWVPIK